MLEKYNYTDKVIWGSFEKVTSLKLRTVDPKISRFASKDEFYFVLFFYFIGLLPFVKLNFNSFQIPYPNKEYISTVTPNSAKNKGSRLSRIGYRFMKYTSPALISHLEKRNIHTILWVITDEDNLTELNKYKIHGIMTDEPSKLIPKIKELP